VPVPLVASLLLLAAAVAPPDERVPTVAQEHDAGSAAPSGGDGPVAPPEGAGEPDAVRAPLTRAFRYSDYEQATLASALAALRLSLDPDPEGKVVEGIDTVRLEVIEERDPAPRFVNAFHVVSRPYVVERESLLRPGDRYQQTLADETRRNLSALPQLSLVLVVATRGAAPGAVRLLVITKDVWSLRLNWDIALTGGGIERFSANPAETNLLGTHQTLGALLTLLPESYSLGAQYAIPRLFGTRIAASADAGFIRNRSTGAHEGSFGDARITQPLWSSRTEWSWTVGGSWLQEVSRLYSGGRVARFALDRTTSCTATPALCVPWEYRTDEASVGGSVTRSFGWAVKHDVTLGFDAVRARYTLPDLSAFDPATVQAFAARRVPVSDDRVGPFVRYLTYSNEFLRVIDLDTLALQEDYRLGPQASLRLQPIFTALGSSRTLLSISAALTYTRALGDGLARLQLDSANDVETAGGRLSDGSVRAALRIATPRAALGRLVLDAVVLDRYANYLNRLNSLGGDSRLRGYATREFVGGNVVTASLEARSRPVQLFQSIQLGGVLFYDVGDAFDRWADLRLKHSVGLGARTLFPQLDRVVFRVDVGFPLLRTPGSSPVSFFATFGQTI
jgi:hypothetical protein